MSARSNAQKKTHIPSKKLGRGLSALIPEDFLGDAHTQSEDSPLKLLELDQVQPNPEQPRLSFNQTALEELAESLRTHGILTPLLVRRAKSGTGYWLIAGERRLRAAGLAGIERVPCFVRDEVSIKEQLEMALVENIQREDLDPIETANAYRRLIEEFSMTQADVARRVGKDRATIANAIRVLRLPPFALECLRAGTITVGHAKALLPLPDDRQLRKAMQDVIKKDLSVRATERMVNQLLQAGGTRRRRTAPAFQHVSEMLTRSLGTRVRIETRQGNDRGRIVIDYHTKDELDRLVQHMWSR
jgi:ParB family chromosome partitioning protein